MKKLSREVFNQIRQWVYFHACYLDVMRWRYHFENGKAEAVVEALSFYQNDDGGFGHGIGDFDNMNPLSSPAAICWGAYGVLREIGCDKTEHPMIQSILRYFESCPHITDKGVVFAIPSNSQYPCRPWFIYSEQPRFPGDQLSPESNISADFVEIVFKHCDKQGALYKKALKILEYRLSAIQNLEGYLAWNTSMWQGFEPHDFCKMIQLAEQFNCKTNEECQLLYGKLLDIVRKHGLPETHRSIKKRIKLGEETPTEEDLDKYIDQLSSGKYWSTGGLACDNPEDKINEICNLGNLWWPIKDAIHDLRVLKEHGRLEETP